MGTIGNHEKGREHRNMALLTDLLFTLLPTTRSLNQWEETSMASIDPCCDTRRRACLRSAQKTLPKLKGCTQRVDMTSGRCQLFRENGLLAKTRGSGKCAQGLPDINRWFPITSYPMGGPGRTRSCRKTTLNTFYKLLNVKMAKNTKNGHF